MDVKSSSDTTNTHITKNASYRIEFLAVLTIPDQAPGFT
jgi:hypothetical protein